MSDEIRNVFNAAVEEGLDKNAIILKLITEGGMDVTTAVREYQKMAKASGIVLSTKERVAKVADMLDGIDITDPKARSEMMTRIADEFDVSEATAAADIRRYAESNGIDLPTAHRNSLEDMVAFVKELLDAGKERGEVVEALQNEMGYSANSAASSYSRALKELGMSSSRSGTTVPLPELVSYIRERQTMPRKELSQAIAKDLGYSEVTAYAFLTYLNFAREWAKQELAAKGVA